MSANLNESSRERQANWPACNGIATRWKPGVSPNPGGAKKGQVYVSECYKRLLLLTSEELQEYKPKNAAEAIALRQVISGIYGQDQFALPSTKEITDRTEGKAPQKVEIAGDLSINVVQVQVLLDTANKLASDHNVSLEVARSWMLAARPELAEVLESE